MALAAYASEDDGWQDRIEYILLRGRELKLESRHAAGACHLIATRQVRRDDMVSPLRGRRLRP